MIGVLETNRGEFIVARHALLTCDERDGVVFGFDASQFLPNAAYMDLKTWEFDVGPPLRLDLALDRPPVVLTVLEAGPHPGEPTWFPW